MVVVAMLALALASCAWMEPNRLDLIELHSRAETDPKIHAMLDEYYAAITARDQARFERAKAELIKAGGGR